MVTLYEDVKTYDRWDAAAIEARAKRLSGLVLGLFPTEKPTVSISFADPKYAEYSCDEPDEATYKAPNYYILLGERVNSTSFAEMLRSVVDRLYELDGSIIEGMARNDEKLNAWSQNVMFSYNPDQVNGEYKVKDTDIYQNVGFSAAHIIRNIAALLDKYDIDHTEFVYSAKITKSTPDKEDD